MPSNSSVDPSDITNVSVQYTDHNRPIKGGPGRKIISCEVDYRNTFDPILYSQILEDMADGLSATQAAVKHGVPPRKLYRWKDIDSNTLAMFQRAQQDYADSLVHNAGKSASVLMDESNVLSIENPKLANAWVQSHAQGVRSAVEVAKRLAPAVYGDRIEHTGQSQQLAFVVNIDPTLGQSHQMQQIEGNQQALIEVKPIERQPPRRSGRQGKTTTRQPKKAGKR